MPRETRIVPDFRTLLCETCGYNLTGIPVEGRCPECGEEIAESLPERRQAAPAERDIAFPYVRTFFRVIASPKIFFRGLDVYFPGNWDRSFEKRCHATAAALLGTALYLHMSLFGDFDWPPVVVAMLSGAIYVVLIALTYLVAWLTAWEARYRGLRLPVWLVLRGLFFHAAHYIPVALVVLTTVIGYRVGVSVGWISVTYGPHYVALLGVEMLLAAWYLFRTYWTAMRNLMYANGSPPMRPL